MSLPVEAQSLSSLTNLLAHPPQYPRNPTHRPFPQIVLYIVRVPGSRDIFLTPVRPPTKSSIGLEAVQSSLYYFHVPTQEDDIIRKEIELEREKWEPEAPSSSPVHRKPLPSLPEDYATLPKSDIPRNGTPEPPVQYSRDPIHSSSQNSDVYVHKESLIGRNDYVTVIRRDPASGSQWNVGTILKRTHRQHDLPLSPIDIELNSPGYGTFAKLDSTRTKGQSSPCFYRKVDYRQADSFAGLQWNDPSGRGEYDQPRTRSQKSVLSFSSPWQGQCTFSNSIDGKSLKLKHSIPSTSNTVEIVAANVAELRFNLSHNPFRSNDAGSEEQDKLSINTLIETRKDRLRQSMQILKEKSRNSFQGSASQELYRDLKNRSANSFDSSRSRDVLRELRNTETSNMSFEQRNGYRQNVESQRRPIPPPLPARQNSSITIDRGPPLPVRQNSTVNSTRGPPPPLPPRQNTIDNLLHAKHSATPQPQLSSIQTHTHIHKDHSHISSDSVPRVNSNVTQSDSEESSDDSQRISLKLGRERAGGGFRGNSAKLGKLILEDEGLKMADLVVAACMGIWWQYYES